MSISNPTMIYHKGPLSNELFVGGPQLIHYEPVPPNIQQQIIAAHAKQKQNEE